MANDPRKTSARTHAAKPCPICGKPAVAAAKPFCSDRCRDVDLNRWLSGSYAIPAQEGEEEDPE
jgi:endogenous inhibitor of DNA gyrase (YacG/DUF329 family)